MQLNLPIKGLRALSLIDYPKKLSAVVFLGGCNFKCPFCHNYDLAVHPETMADIDTDEILFELQRRKKLLEGVVLTGGEPTLYPDIVILAQEIKTLGYSVKLDTNGYKPEVLKRFIDEKIADFISMDIKTALDKEKYQKAAGISKIDLSKISQSIQFLMDSKVDYEFRTTLINEFVNKEDILQIGQTIKNCKIYWLQPANPDLPGYTGPNEQEIQALTEDLRKMGVNACHK